MLILVQLKPRYELIAMQGYFNTIRAQGTKRAACLDYLQILISNVVCPEQKGSVMLFIHFSFVDMYILYE